MNSVWIVSEGESCEGGHVTGVFATQELALQFCADEDVVGHGCDYVEIMEVQVIESLPAPPEHESWGTRGALTKDYL